MIKANELRIGNLVLLDGKHNAEVTKIDAGNDTVTTKNNYNLYIDGSTGDCWRLSSSFVTGIPLTPEWLERCGFTKAKDDEEGVEAAYGIVKMNVNIAKIGGGWYARTENHDSYYDHSISTEIKNVHQLQNLYFALTGEELPIDLGKTLST